MASFQDWHDFHDNESKQDYYKPLMDFVKSEYANHTCYPPYCQIFNAMQTTPYDKVKCVILGQDPYHGPNQAMGLSFSVNDGVPIPRSLQNIYKEIQSEYGYDIPKTGNLSHWAEQGVLLLNSMLTVNAGSPTSHRDHGWERYTDDVLSFINEKEEPVVFMLWGSFARSKKPLITNKQHLVLEATHPSPFSADKGFFGCGHFKKCNDFLINNHIEPIDWKIS